jgi:methylmalonyl-CoA carboxyltransferase large subunit
LSDDGTPTVEQLQALVADLAERLTRLETRFTEHHMNDELPEELVLVIGAACAAYLGKRATVKHVRLHRPQAWAQQGRAELQHSHQVRR